MIHELEALFHWILHENVQIRMISPQKIMSDGDYSLWTLMIHFSTFGKQILKAQGSRWM